MLLKRLFLVAAIGILVMASCARKAANFSDDVKIELMSDFRMQDDVRVTRIVNGDQVYSEIHSFNGPNSIEDGLDAIFHDVEFSLTDMSIDFSEDDTLSLNLRSDGNGDVLDISAEFPEDEIGEITIETSR